VDPTPAPPTPAPPPTPAHPVARTGTIDLTVVGAAHSTISVDGKIVARDVAKTALELAPGDHVLRVEAPERKPVQRKVRVEAGRRSALQIPLEKKSINGVIDPFAE
jgi:hypothetical protein